MIPLIILMTSFYSWLTLEVLSSRLQSFVFEPVEIKKTFSFASECLSSTFKKITLGCLNVFPTCKVKISTLKSVN